MQPESSGGTGSSVTQPTPLPLIRAAVKLLWDAEPRLVVGSVIVYVVIGACSGLQLIVGRRLLSVLIRHGELSSRLSPVTFGLVLVVLLTMLITAMASGQGAVTRLLAERAIRHFQEVVLTVATGVRLEDYERPAFHDQLRRALGAGNTTPIGVTLGLSGTATGLAMVIGVAVALLLIQPLLLAIVLLTAIPIWLSGRRISEGIYSFAFGQTETDRRLRALERLMSTREYGAEIRAFSAEEFIRDRWRRLFDQRLAAIRGLVRRWLKASMTAGLVSTLLQGLALAGLIWLLALKRIDLSSAAIAAVALLQLAGLLQRTGAAVSQLYEASLFLVDLRELAAIPRTTPSDETCTSFSRLAIEDVWFTYPESIQPALRGVSLEIERGQVVALVGANGAGKTTLAKIVCALYEPTQGRLTWDGIDMASKPADYWRSAISVTFQDFLRYPLSARDNIAVGEALSDGAVDDERVKQAAISAGADGLIERLPAKYETILAKEFEGGYDLSVGQWQRVALARSFLRSSLLLVLDEPTSALDPRAERDLFDAIRELFGDRSVLLISHRFSSVRAADRIVVLDDGVVVESGTHDELMRANGMYSEMFNAQVSAFFGDDREQTSRSDGAAFC